MLKRCSECRIEKPLCDFYRDKRTKSGYYSACKKCHKKTTRKYRQTHKIEIVKYLQTHKEEISNKKRKYRKTHKIQIAKTQHNHYKIHKKELTEKMRQYCKTPRGKLAKSRARHNRDTRERNTKATLTVEQWAKILIIQNNRCNMCNKRFVQKNVPSMDHIIPLSCGGDLTFENVQALCLSCNKQKQAKLNTQFIQTWGL